MRLIMTIFSISFICYLAIASDSPNLDELQKTMTGVGACDQTRSPILEFKADGYAQVLRFDPVANSNIRYIVLIKDKKDNSSNRYFKIETDKDKTVTNIELNPMQWYIDAQPLSANFANYIMFPNAETDCTLAENSK